ncbi:hypothetical protein [Dietzia maris]|uniref:hypothetical protein n=1 Tax=Dietzia maris TaxID=37915 RepID=UPI0037CB4833
MDDREQAGSAPKNIRWFPKPFTQGDMHGQGVEKLLGRPDLEKMEVLVRETAQNSWDARGNSETIDFRLNLRQLSPESLNTLRSAVFIESGGELGLDKLLSRQEVWALEISDRGTVGLAGTTRTDLEPVDGEPTNFIDFVYDLGAPKREGMTGGTYGYGKTISYSSSGVGTVLIWSRSQNGGKLENRLIGSAIGPSFSMSGRRYTGRHWWGDVLPNDERVEPIIGTHASDIAQKIFSETHEGETTGTSILILDPDFGEAWSDPSDQAALLAKFVQNHLWPKMIDSDVVPSRMNISVALNGMPVPIGDHESRKIRSAYAACLNEIRSLQAGKKRDTESMLHLVSIERYKDTVGHLCLTRFPQDVRHLADPSDDDLAPSSLRENRVALMRHEAELVVKYLDFPALPIEGFAWVGVFKPVSRADAAFAAAEPPAHDEWNPATVSDKIQKSVVNVALRKIREAANSYLAPSKPQNPASAQPPAAQIGDFLSGLLVGLPGSAPKKARGPGRPSPPKKLQAKPQVVSVRTDPMPGGDWNSSIVTITLTSGDSNEHRVAVELSIGTERGRGDPVNSGVVRNMGWLTDVGVSNEPSHTMRNGEQAFYVFDFSVKVAIDVRARVETAQ